MVPDADPTSPVGRTPRRRHLVVKSHQRSGGGQRLASEQWLVVGACTDGRLQAGGVAHAQLHPGRLTHIQTKVCQALTLCWHKRRCT